MDCTFSLKAVTWNTKVMSHINDLQYCGKKGKPPGNPWYSLFEFFGIEIPEIPCTETNL